MRNSTGQDFNFPFYVLVIFFIAIVWQLTWKGIALWRSASQKQRNWFLVLFVLTALNDLGIVEIIYLFGYSKKRMTIAEVKNFISNIPSLFSRS